MEKHYITFDQAKWLKEIGFKEKCETSYYLQNNERLMVEDNGITKITPMYNYSRPEHHQVVEWLRVNHGIWVNVDMVYAENQTGFWYCIRESKNDDRAIDSNEYPTPKEAYSAAFDYIKENKLI